MIWLRLVSAKWCAGVDAWLHPGDVAVVVPEEAPYWLRGYAVPLDPQPSVSGPSSEVRLRVKLLVPGQLIPAGALFGVPGEAAEALISLGAAERPEDPTDEPEPNDEPDDEPPPEEPPAEQAESTDEERPEPEDEEDVPQASGVLYYKGEEAHVREDGMVVDAITGEDYATEAAWKAAVTKRLKAELGG